ncbi:CSC1-like protein 2 [Cichlidogyrus casuarinus]|uniref:CSC1-like protein 2 n=1 Tax=Cichlidogyrus casuarinus TaxID=1844966 RepID=A0ABD2QFP0_9PLAT
MENQTNISSVDQRKFLEKDKDLDLSSLAEALQSQLVDLQVDSMMDYEESFNEFFSDDDDFDMEESLDGNVTPKLTLDDDFEDQLGLSASNVLSAQEALDSEFSEIAKLGLIQVGGEDNCGRKIIMIFASQLPPHQTINYDHLFNYLRLTLIQYVSSDYSLIYFHHGLTRANRPNVSWLIRCYNAFDREFKKNLKILHLVHPTTFVKSTHKVFDACNRKIVSSAKVNKKINYIHRLDELNNFLDLNRLAIPIKIKSYDKTLDELPKSTNFWTRTNNSKQDIHVTSPVHKQFGVSLEHISEYHSPDGVAPIMTQCMDYIRKHGLDTEGIFRKSVSSELVNDLHKNFEKGQAIQLDDPHVAAVLLKYFLRSLKDPLIPNSFLLTISTIMKSKQVTMCRRDFVSKLSEINCTVLKKLCEFLHEVSMHSEQNKMTLTILMFTSDSDIAEKCGMDSVHFLQFLRYLIIYSGVTMVLSLTIPLPLNMLGDLKTQNISQFGVTTISNIKSDSNLLWGHVICAICFFLFASFLMFDFFRYLIKSDMVQNAYTLLIHGIPRSSCKIDLLSRHFQEAYPNYPVSKLRFAYDVCNLTKLENLLNATKKARKSALNILETDQYRPVVVPCICSWLPETRANKRLRCIKSEEVSDKTLSTDDEYGQSGCCCNSNPPVDAINYYSTSIVELEQKIKDEQQVAMKKCVGIALITFEKHQHALEVKKNFESSCSKVAFPTASTVSSEIKCRRWTVTFAPTPADICWFVSLSFHGFMLCRDNLALKRTIWWIRSFLVNLALAILVIFLTTPAYMLTILESMGIKEALIESNAFLAQTIPTLLLLIFTAILPLIVSQSEYLIGHWRYTTLNLAMMTKSYFYLLLMVLILPSLGLTTVPQLIKWIFYPIESSMVANSTNGDQDFPAFRWQCIFNVDNGAFFVNYVISSAFIGCSLELARIPGLIKYV